MMLALIAMAIIGLVAFYNLWLFDCLARWEFEYHREQWEHDGKPSGFLVWRPKESKAWSSGRIEQHLNLQWTLKMPDWAAKSPKCRRWIFQKRLTSLVAVLIILGVLLEIFFHWQ